MVHGVGVTSWPVVAGAGAKHAAEGMAGGGCRIDALQTRVGGWALLWGSWVLRAKEHRRESLPPEPLGHQSPLRRKPDVCVPQAFPQPEKSCLPSRLLSPLSQKFCNQKKNPNSFRFRL